MGELVDTNPAAANQTPGEPRPSSRRLGPADPAGLERTIAVERARRGAAEPEVAAADAPPAAVPAELPPMVIPPEVAIRATANLARSVVYGAAIGATYLDSDLADAVLEAGTEVEAFAVDVGPDLAELGGRYVVWGGHVCRFANIWLRKVAARKIAERRRFEAAAELRAGGPPELRAAPPPAPPVEAPGA